MKYFLNAQSVKTFFKQTLILFATFFLLISSSQANDHKQTEAKPVKRFQIKDNKKSEKNTKKPETKNNKHLEIKTTKKTEIKEVNHQPIKVTAKHSEEKNAKQIEVKEIKKEEKRETKPTELKEAKPRPIKDTRPITEKLWQGITTKELETLKQIILAIEHHNYDEAMKYYYEIRSEEDVEKEKQNQTHNSKADFLNSIKDIILWNKYSDKDRLRSISFSDISRFTNDNPFYPNIDELKRNAEKVAIINNIPYQTTEKYFKTNPASTTESKIYLLQSKIDFLLREKISEDKKTETQREIQKIAADIWIKENFSLEEERVFLEKYNNQLTELEHISRIERLLFDNKTPEAKRIINLVDEDHKNLFLTIIELQDSPKYIDNLVLGVPRKLRSNEALSYRRVLWYKAKDKIDDLLDVMVDLPKISKFPEKWWSLRRLYAREMIKQKKYKIAYTISSNHSLPYTASDYWEAEWTSGWIALRFLNEPETAYVHFKNLYDHVSQPVTISRAAYWLGMTFEAMKKKDAAIAWYKIATKYPTFFYGQLAIHKHRALDILEAEGDIILPKDPDISGKDLHSISQSKPAQVAYLLAITGDKANASKIFEWLVSNVPTEGQAAVIMKIVNEIGDRQLDARISRIAAKRNIFFIKDKFQIVKEVVGDSHAPLVHAIIKQESGFAPTALSAVGAVGFMQLMPNTAKLVTKEMGVKYDRHKLATDISYNVKLGSFYIQKLVDRFEGSEMLAIASYNAGPNATQRWINEFYDPRKEKDLDKVVDWIELITYSETRNYVQRIMENLIVYKYLMSRSNYDNIQ